MIRFILSLFKGKASNTNAQKHEEKSAKKAEGPLEYPEYHYEYGFRPFWV